MKSAAVAFHAFSSLPHGDTEYFSRLAENRRTAHLRAAAAASFRPDGFMPFNLLSCEDEAFLRQYLSACALGDRRAACKGEKCVSAES